MRNGILLYLFLIAFVFAGCSTGVDNPANPSDNKVGLAGSTAVPVGVSDYLADSSPAAGYGALGLFNLNIDPVNLKADLVPLRNTALADVLEVVDITNFLKLAPCTNCVKLKSVALDADGNIVLSIGIKHPFPAGDPIKPITGRNRADLHVFNIEGTVISKSTGDTFPGIGGKTAGFTLLNADGYTSYLDAVLDGIYPTDATIHPYKLHFDDYSKGNFDPANLMGFASVTDPPPTGNLVMAMGCDYNFQDYVFAPSTSDFDIIYAVGCTYALTAQSKNQRFSPEYRIPQHNKKAASEVWIEEISNNLVDGDISSTAQIAIKVVDISHGVSVGTGLDQMLIDSSVGNIYIEIPGVMTDVLSIDGTSSSSGTGHDPSDPLVYQATITNTSAALEGTYHGLVKVLDSYAPGQNTAPTLNGKDGISRVDPMTSPLTGLFDIAEFATYQTFEISVAVGNTPPVADLKSIPDPAIILEGQKVHLDASGSSDFEDDRDGIPLMFEFMWNYDGIPANFAPDFGPSTTDQVDTAPYLTVGTYIAAVRVTDSGGLKDIATVDVEVLPTPPQQLVVYSTWTSMFTALPDYTQVRNLGRMGYYPCISQYNNVIVYCDGYTGNIRAMNVDGTNDRLVVTGLYRYPTVSANGSKIAFYDITVSPSTSSCYIVNGDGSNLIKLNPDDGNSWRYACVSGNGQRVAMLRMLSPYSIYVCNVDGTSLVKIKDSVDYCSITYDGEWVFYSAPFQIRRIKFDGTQDQAVIGTSATSVFAITPDGTKVAYTQYYSGNGNDLGVYDLVTRIETRLTFGNRNASQKTITVDGQWIITDGFAVALMYSIKTDGTGPIFDWGSGDYPSAHGCVGEHY